MSNKKYNTIKETEHLLSTAANTKRLSESMEQAESINRIPLDDDDLKSSPASS